MNAESLLDFSKPINVKLFDETVKFFFEGKIEYQNVLVKFQNHAQAWTCVYDILEKSPSPHAKMIGLNILDECIKTRWKILPKQQKDGIKTYIFNLIIKISSNTKLLTQFSVFIRKLNMVLIQIVKQDWPRNWPNFILELVNSSKSNQSICTNNIHILLLLSEEVFDYSSGHMTQEKVTRMKTNLNREFTRIFQLCDYILDNSQDCNLLSMTLQTLLRFLQWIPVVYIFETKLIETLTNNFFPIALFQNDTLRCLTEIGSLKLDPPRPQYNPKFIQMIVVMMTSVEKLLEPKTNLAKMYLCGDPKAQTFVRHLTLFITGFLKVHLNLLEGEDSRQHQVLLLSLSFLLRISEVEDVTIFKICLDYWNILVVDLYNSQKNMNNASIAPRVQLYREILQKLREVIISKMSKPEEVLIVEDENGEIVREQMKNTDSIILYENMRDCLIYLTHLDATSTHEIMINKLSKQVDGSEWSWHNLNTLCWSIGSISGSLSDSHERPFVVRVIRDLLTLCEMQSAKDDKAVIASNIMYVVGQYPQFLRQHWNFLKTVVNKLFDFMHERHPGVQDMSCDTFLKITKKCSEKFVVTQVDESKPFIEVILNNLPVTMRDLEMSQIHTFYEAVAHIIKSHENPKRWKDLLFQLMELPNQSWNRIVMHASHNPEILQDENVVKQIVFILTTNIRVVASLGYRYFPQLDRIYLDLLNVYTMYSDFILNQIQDKGEGATQLPLIQNMRLVKKNTIKLIECFVKMCQDSQKDVVYTKILPSLMQPILGDYKKSIPDARDTEVLLLFSTIISKLGSVMVQHVPAIFDSAFQCTLDMITKNFQDYPEHRIMFFELLRVINNSCFQALLRLDPKQFELVVDSVVWAFKHLRCDIAESGLNILLELIKNMENATDVAKAFYQTFYMSLLQDLLGVLTDRFHKSGFILHTIILSNLFRIVASGSITVPLWREGDFLNNQTYVQQRVVFQLRRSFQNLTRQQVEVFVTGLFKLHNNIGNFRGHLRDFLIELKEFKKEDNSKLFLEEQQKIKSEKMSAEKARNVNVSGRLSTGPSVKKK